MSGITGVLAFNLVGKFSKINVSNSTISLATRFKEAQDIYVDEWVCLGQRLSLEQNSSDFLPLPYWDENNRYAIVFEGEIFNSGELIEIIRQQGQQLLNQSDAEVILKLFISRKNEFLSLIQGAFAFCIYDKIDQSFFLACDSQGLKTIYYLFDEDKFLFGSSFRATIEYGISKEIDPLALSAFLHKIPTPSTHTFFNNIKKLQAGHCLKISTQKIENEKFVTTTALNLTEVAKDESSVTVKFNNLLLRSLESRLNKSKPPIIYLDGHINSPLLLSLVRNFNLKFKTFSVYVNGYTPNKIRRDIQGLVRDFNLEHSEIRIEKREAKRLVNDLFEQSAEPVEFASTVLIYMAQHGISTDIGSIIVGSNAIDLFRHSGKPETTAFSWSRINPIFNAKTEVRKIITRLDSYKASKNKIMSQPLDRKWLKNLYSEDYRDKIFYREFENDLPKKEIGFQYFDSLNIPNLLPVQFPFLDPDLVNFVGSVESDPARRKILQNLVSSNLKSFVNSIINPEFNLSTKYFIKRLITRDLRHEFLSKDFIKDQGIFNYGEIKKLRWLNSIGYKNTSFSLPNLLFFQWWWKKWTK